MKLILATNNKGKVREYREILTPLGYEVISQSEAGINIEAEETGVTFRENAYIKAKAIYDITHTAVIADDSGLCVDALDGRPGVYSARYGIDYPDSKISSEITEYCKKNGGDAKAKQRLLDELDSVPLEKRTAHFTCVICMINPDGETIYAEGRCEGKIGFELRGTNGFGYDPLFIYGDKTLAELSDDEKNAVSHRGAAAASLVLMLAEKNDKNAQE